jgi:hypothetical protein
MALSGNTSPPPDRPFRIHTQGFTQQGAELVLMRNLPQLFGVHFFPLSRARPNAAKVANNSVTSSKRFFVLFPSKCPAMVATSAGANTHRSLLTHGMHQCTIIQNGINLVQFTAVVPVEQNIAIVASEMIASFIIQGRTQALLYTEQ